MNASSIQNTNNQMEITIKSFKTIDQSDYHIFNSMQKQKAAENYNLLQ